MPCTRETAQSSYRAGLRLLERINTRSRENVVDGAGLAGSSGGHSRGGAHAPPARTPTTSSGDYGYGSRLLFPLQQLKLQNKDIDHTYFTHIMAANNTSRCVRFGDGTPPLCHANNLPQGQLCQQCDNEDRSARDTYENSGPQARRALLLRENQNLRLMNTLKSSELGAEISCKEAWQQAVKAKTSERDMLVKQRDQAK